MVERGQPRKCSTPTCSNGTHDETQQCATCRRLNRILNEAAGRVDDLHVNGPLTHGTLVIAPPADIIRRTS